MPVDAVHMIANREWQGENNDVDDRVMRTSLTVFMERNWVKNGSEAMIRSKVLWAQWNASDRPLRSVMSCTKRHIEKLLMIDE